MALSLQDIKSNAADRQELLEAPKVQLVPDLLWGKGTS